MRLENWIGNEDGKLGWKWGWKTGLGMRKLWSTCSVCQAPYQCLGVPLLTLIFATPTFVTPSAGISDSGGQLYSWSVGYEFGLLPCDLQGMNDIHDMYKVAKYGCGQQLRSEAFINTCSVVAWLCRRLWGLLVVGWHSGACRSTAAHTSHPWVQYPVTAGSSLSFIFASQKQKNVF